MKTILNEIKYEKKKKNIDKIKELEFEFGKIKYFQWDTSMERECFLDRLQKEKLLYDR